MCPGFLFVAGQNASAQYGTIWICVSCRLHSENCGLRKRLSWNKRRLNRLGPSSRFNKSGGGGNMTVSHTPNSSAGRTRAVRLKIASRLYKALVAKNPDRVIVLRDGGGRMVSRHEPQMSGDHRNLPFRDAPSLVPVHNEPGSPC